MPIIQSNCARLKRRSVYYASRMTMPNVGQGIDMRLPTRGGILVLGALSFVWSSAHAGLFEAETFERCIIKNMPGTANDVASKFIILNCSQFQMSAAGSGRGLWAKYPNGAECYSDKGKSVSDQLAAAYLLAACFTLYDRPRIDPNAVVMDPGPPSSGLRTPANDKQGIDFPATLPGDFLLAVLYRPPIQGGAPYMLAAFSAGLRVRGGKGAGSAMRDPAG